MRSGWESPIAVVPPFVRVTVTVPSSPGKNVTGSMVTFET